ncbi:HAD-IC family P-type ATPase [Candidatus Uhrbacteria bacterium]|jgi:P-type Ca2+ transporter type 2C|nr:HAD-IC family P-type ATPase [Candidatus Uhrbacteria bacterium]
MDELSREPVISWSTHSVADIFSELNTGTDGLSENQATERLKEGRNELPKKPPASAIKLFFDQLASPLMAILVIAGLMSAFLGEWLDTTVILIAVLLNAVLGFFEEYKADRSLEALSTFLPEEVRVRRDGETQSINTTEIVPGDIVLLQTGDKVSADGRLLQALSIEMNEASLTGESAAVKKETGILSEAVSVADETNMVFAGTVVVAGRGEYVVTATGIETQIGQISDMVSRVKEDPTPLQLQLKHFARFLGMAVLVLAGIVFAIGMWRGFDAVEMFQVSVALSVSAVPEGLIVALTVILAIGMQRILKRKALVRRLVGAETLGSVSVICMDKTGTLTTGEMEVVLFDGDEERTKVIMAATNTASRQAIDSSDEIKFIGSPTEVAMARASQYSSVENIRTLHELPFDSVRKYKAARVDTDGDRKLFVIGAPDLLLERLDVTDRQRSEWMEKTNELAERGLRVLLVCERSDDQVADTLLPEMVIDLSVVGIIGLEDPLRDSANVTVKEARMAGLRPVMITGDHPDTAFVIAKRVGLANDPSQVVTGIALDDMTDEQLAIEIKKLSVFARVLPRHKLRLVRAWQDTGATVAMIGDGVNDAPAMKAADIGIALGSGTAVTKETADMVLLDNHFKTIIAAIREGRIMFDNIRKMIVYLLSDSFSEIILILGALLLSVPLPILPAQILWINLVTDGFSSVALTFEPGEDGVMREPPRKKREPLLNMEMKIIIFVIGFVTDLILFAVYFFLLDQAWDIDHIRTFIFVALGLDSLLYVFAVRKFRKSIFRSNPFENKWLVVSMALGLVLLLLPLVFAPLRELFSFTSLSSLEWVAVVVLGMVDLLLIEIVKAIFIRLHTSSKGARVGDVSRQS